MAKSQKRSNREIKKPKAIKAPAPAAVESFLAKSKAAAPVKKRG